ncbi:hypothetical protein [Paenibacillus sp. UMB4589-SE434]|uniref:hypothetical protein n=1 Tax=Paenibacillus sp. UMB4589-SE434 TaxID=3046314 RepID=UPI00254C5467|nr:hypothetical protein [Paenibacillus sp. UMB4589-SE434]
MKLHQDGITAAGKTPDEQRVRQMMLWRRAGLEGLLMYEQQSSYPSDELTKQYLNQEHARGVDEVNAWESINGTDHNSPAAEIDAVSGSLQDSDDNECVGDACPVERGAKATNQMINESYGFHADDLDYELK